MPSRNDDTPLATAPLSKKILDQFLSILGEPGARGESLRSDAELEEILVAECGRKVGSLGGVLDCGESKWRGRFQELASKVEFENYQNGLVVSSNQSSHYSF